jgi:FkbM family methyltransferase
MIDFKLPYNDYFSGYAEKYDLRTFGRPSREAALLHVKNFRNAIDIGAHVGISVLDWAEKFNNVYAFEPMIDHFNCLKINTQHLKNATLYNIAISNESKILKGAYRSTKNTGSFQLLDDLYQQPSKKAPREIFNIPSRRLDEFLLSDVDLIKIDVEGWELEVLKGSIETIKNNQPVLLIEFTGGQSKKSLHSYDVLEYHSLIAELNYIPVATLEDDTIYIPK